MRVLGIFFTFCLNGSPDTLPHLRRRCLRKCHNQKPVDINRILRIKNSLDNTCHKHRCFSRSRCRRDENIPVSEINDVLLFLRPFHLIAPPFPCFWQALSASGQALLLFHGCKLPVFISRNFCIHPAHRTIRTIGTAGFYITPVRIHRNISRIDGLSTLPDLVLYIAGNHRKLFRRCHF